MSKLSNRLAARRVQRRSWHSVQRTLWLCAQPSWLGCIFMTFLVYLLYHLGDRTIYNSDLVQPYLLVGDLMMDRNALFTWYHSPALYIFPDWLLSLIVVAVPLPGSWMPLVYGALNLA